MKKYQLYWYLLISKYFWLCFFRCEPGLIPNPDTITGCKPECVVDPDCGDRDYICENQK